MPGGMNGVELAKQAVGQRPLLKVLLTSGYAGESLDEWLSQGAWPFLRKPFLSTELAEALADLDPGRPTIRDLGRVLDKSKDPGHPALSPPAGLVQDAPADGVLNF